MYEPDLKEVFRGALSPSTPDVHYVTEFRYPERGGFAGFLEGFAAETDLRLGWEVTRIDPVTRQVHMASKPPVAYEHLISSIPLPELIPMIQGVPDDVVEAVGRLAATECVVVNLGIDREDVADTHWTYFYDPEISFARLSYPSRFAPANAPEGTGSFQAEVYFSEKYRPRRHAPEEWIDPVVADLRKTGLIRDGDEILLTCAWLIPYANIIFDLDRAAALETVHGFLQDVGIRYCGRYALGLPLDGRRLQERRGSGPGGAGLHLHRERSDSLIASVKSD